MGPIQNTELPQKRRIIQYAEVDTYIHSTLHTTCMYLKIITPKLRKICAHCRTVFENQAKISFYLKRSEGGRRPTEREHKKADQADQADQADH